MANAYYKNGSSWINMANIFYPVGAYYLANVSTSPSNLFGGTWQQITDARFLCAYSSAGGDGGENSHVLTVSEMPSHRHTQNTPYYGDLDGSHTGHVTYWSRYSNTALPVTSYTGGNAAHNNMPLYRTCYCWYRTA